MMKIAVIDDHRLFREGLTALLGRHHIEVVTFTNDAQGLLDLSHHKVDIILIDMRMPRMSGLEVLTQIKTKNISNAPIVILTTSHDEKDLKNALQAGAQAYLLKDMKPEELVSALDDVLSGKIIVAKEMTHLLAKILKDKLYGKQNIFDKLTPKEKEVACLIASGLNNKRIACELNISDGTVKLHVKAILRKFQLHSRVEVAIMLIENSFCKNNLASRFAKTS